jgi:flagellin-like protein
MSTEDNGSDCAQPRTFGKTTIATGQDLPTVVRLIGIADVPSFAPSIIAISAAGLFVSALVLQSRRDEEQEELDEMTLEDDEQAVSPVIATILMVAITVVLSGVIYVWASSLADTSAKGVPRISFTLDSSQALGGEDSFHRITVTASQVELATQAVQVTVEYTDSVGETVTESYNLADTTVYGFFPGNSDTMVTFTDAVGAESGVTKSSFDTGDTIYIRTSTADGEPLTNLYVSISYNPANGAPGSVLRTWSGL